MAKPTASHRVLAELAAQHARLRDMIDRCEDLADGVDTGDVEPAQLLGEVVALRIAFDGHNQFEEQLLRPVLLDAHGSGAVRVSRMVDDHVDEHRSIRRELDRTTTAELRAVLASLLAHLASEDRYFAIANAPRGHRVR